MSKIFLTSDTHFFHKNILKYCDRPFNSIEEMNTAIINKWNLKVGSNDEIYHLGDFAFGGIEKILSILEILNGRIRIVPGNHDTKLIKYWKNLNTQERTQKSFELLPPIYTLNIGTKAIILSHYPIESWAWKESGSIHLHGHSHGNTSHGVARIPNRYDVGIDVYGDIIELTEDLSNLNNNKNW